MAHGFAQRGHEVTVVCYRPSEKRVSQAELAHIYGLRKPVRWIQVPRKLLQRPIGQHWEFCLLALPVVLLMRPDLVFARSYIFPWLSSKVGIPTVVESHAPLDNRTAPFLHLVDAASHRNLRLWVTISGRLADHYRSLGVPRDKLIVLPDGADISFFSRPSVLPPSPYTHHAPIAVYTGHLYDYKGIPTILETAALRPDVQFHLVGGWPEDVARQQARIELMGLSNVTLHGLKAQVEIPPFLWHANALLLPPSANHPSAAWTSPLKLGEYLASGTPTVATSIPALRDWLSEDEVEFVNPDDPGALAAGITEVLKDRIYARNLTRRGLEKVRNFSYESRAQRILDRLEESTANGKTNV
jgi:glycosyltransferase involved in cell wall biosynthesis